MGCMGKPSMSYDDYRKEMSKKGTEYENYIYPIFAKEWGVPEDWVKPYAEKDQQIKIGENWLGVEIKYDEKSIKSPNLYIEVEEKGHEKRIDYTRSGIFRPDNTFLFLIGNYDIYYVFEIDTIRKLFKNYKTIENGRCTSKGFLLPKPQARESAINVSVLKEENEFEQLAFHWAIQPFPKQI